VASSAKLRNLGRSVCDFVSRTTSFEPYFADNQSTLDDLIQNVFAALDRCAGFIAIMHHRDEVATPEAIKIRGSIWIEQELAIAAFLQNIVGKQIQVRLYVERGIIREGLRDKLILNPVVFDADKEVIEDLAQVLPSWDASDLRFLLILVTRTERVAPATTSS